MKYRNGFVSNSSSSSFILKIDDLSDELKNNINQMDDLSDDLGRGTGVIRNLQEWIWMTDDWYGLINIVEEHGNDNLIMIRESDEGMGGYFDMYDIDYNEVSDLAIHEFEYH